MSDPYAAAAAVVERGGDADDILRGVLAALHDHGVAYAAIRFVEDGNLVPGPAAGAGTPAVTVPVEFDGQSVGELALSDDDPGLAARVAELVGPLRTRRLGYRRRDLGSVAKGGAGPPVVPVTGGRRSLAPPPPLLVGARPGSAYPSFEV
jgi:hypothetical protein